MLGLRAVYPLLRPQLRGQQSHRCTGVAISADPVVPLRIGDRGTRPRQASRRCALRACRVGRRKGELPSAGREWRPIGLQTARIPSRRTPPLWFYRRGPSAAACLPDLRRAPGAATFGSSRRLACRRPRPRPAHVRRGGASSAHYGASTGRRCRCSRLRWRRTESYPDRRWRTQRACPQVVEQRSRTEQPHRFDIGHESVCVSSGGIH